MGHDLAMPVEPIVVPHRMLVPSAGLGLPGPDEGLRSEDGLRYGQAEEFVGKMQAVGGKTLGGYLEVRTYEKISVT